MKIHEVKTYGKIVLCYWLFIVAIVYLEIRYMEWTWSGIPGFLFTLPFSAFVVTVYLAASYAREIRGYDINLTVYQIEYGFLICAVINVFLFYPVYGWWLRRKRTRVTQTPPPPPPRYIS